ncbi:hypothetical protein [Pedobacter agri]|uniref:hypothetical protein n=1 Tax=Pedobacter agri TaxID=454586 RepID=UPI002931644A|nr:hypothetical protein [Pedobacter agri]
MSKLRINLFGESFRISSVSQIPLGFLPLEPIQFNESLSTLILEKNHPLIFKMIRQGLLDTYKNRIEIWFAGKKIHKTNISEIDSETALFPLFSSATERFNMKWSEETVYLEEREIGLIAVYEANLEKFNPDQLCFVMSLIKYHQNEMKVLGNIRYQNKSLIARPGDNLQIRSYFLKND